MITAIVLLSLLCVAGILYRPLAVWAWVKFMMALYALIDLHEELKQRAEGNGDASQ